MTDLRPYIYALQVTAAPPASIDGLSGAATPTMWPALHEAGTELRALALAVQRLPAPTTAAPVGLILRAPTAQPPSLLRLPPPSAAASSAAPPPLAAPPAAARTPTEVDAENKLIDLLRDPHRTADAVSTQLANQQHVLPPLCVSEGG